MSYIKRFINIGLDPQDDVFDVRLKRAINVLALNALLMISFAGLFGYFIQENNTSLYILLSLPVFSWVIYLNKKKKSFLAISILFMFSAFLLIFFSLRTGEEAYTHIHFTLNLIGVALLYQKETARKYLYLNLAFTIASLLFLFVCFEYDWFDFLLDKQVNPIAQRKLNVVVLLVGALIFSFVVIRSHVYQNKALNAALDVQKILLAEVNHRVKNNMAVIISLINMKKNVSVYPETLSALSEIQDQVLSMALVHRKIYEEKNKNAVDVKSFVAELAEGIMKSFPSEKKVSIQTVIANVELDVSKAIPFGLILNELITNSMKHAFNETDKPNIQISLQYQSDKCIFLSYQDNGIGLNPESLNGEDKIGMELMRALAEQLDGEVAVKNRNGFLFELKIPFVD